MNHKELFKSVTGREYDPKRDSAELLAIMTAGKGKGKGKATTAQKPEKKRDVLAEALRRGVSDRRQGNDNEAVIMRLITENAVMRAYFKDNHDEEALAKTHPTLAQIVWGGVYDTEGKRVAELPSRDWSEFDPEGEPVSNTDGEADAE